MSLLRVPALRRTLTCTDFHSITCHIRSGRCADHYTLQAVRSHLTPPGTHPRWSRRYGTQANSEANLRDIENPPPQSKSSQGGDEVPSFRQTLGSIPYPSSDQYPLKASSKLFDPRQAHVAINKLCEKWRIECNVDIDIVDKYSLFEPHEPHRDRFTCELEVEIVNIASIKTQGQAHTKQIAKQVAWARAVSQMHTDGSLKALVSGVKAVSEVAYSLELDQTTQGSDTISVDSLAIDGEDESGDQDQNDDRMDSQLLDPNTLVEEKDAKIDILNYTIGLGGLIPEFTARLLQPEAKLESKYARRVEATISLPTRHVSISAIGHDLVAAETAAAIAFKRKVEQQPWRKPEDTIPWSLLNSDNAEDFVMFAKDDEPHKRYELEHEGVMYAESSQNQASLSIDGRTLCSVRMQTKKQAILSAKLLAAVQLVKEKPELLFTFRNTLLVGNGKYLRKVAPIGMSLSVLATETMLQATLKARRSGLPDSSARLDAEPSTTVRDPRIRTLSHARLQALSDKLQKTFEQRQSDPVMQKLQATRDALPISKYKQDIIQLISQNQYSIILGATGSGKTTQVPQQILDEAVKNGTGAFCNIYCTQPRRVAAIAVAKRVADERGEEIGHSIGYHVRFESRIPKRKGSITYCTTGLLLTRLAHDPERFLTSASHIIIDEAHERSRDIDILMIVLRRFATQRKASHKPMPKIVIMSATLDLELFSEYFGGSQGKCPSVSVPGRLFPIKETYLNSIVSDLQTYHKREYFRLLASESDEARLTNLYVAQDEVLLEPLTGRDPVAVAQIDWKRPHAQSGPGPSADIEHFVPVCLVAATIARICNVSNHGAILVFLPGFDEISRVRELLTRESDLFGVKFGDPQKFNILRLHSGVSLSEQMDVFGASPPGCRKIILSTNIAETSVTVPDVKYVVDSGKARETRFDERSNIANLECVWESRSNAKQRAGRAGRVQDGHYYALFSKARFESFRPSGLSELSRSELSNDVLYIKSKLTEDNVKPFLAEAIEPPPERSVEAAIDELKSLEALTEDESLTVFGRAIAEFPVPPRPAKLIILGLLFRCLEPMLIISALTDTNGLFMRPLQHRAAARIVQQAFDDCGSYQVACYNAYKMLRELVATSGGRKARILAASQHLDWNTFSEAENIVRLTVRSLIDSKLMPSTREAHESPPNRSPPLLNVNSDNTDLIKCLVMAVYAPQLGVPSGRKAGKETWRTQRETKVVLHPASVLDKKRTTAMRDAGMVFGYETMKKSNDGQSIFIRDATGVTPMMSVLLGGKLEVVDWRTLRLNSWLPFRIKAQDSSHDVAKLVLEFKKALNRVLAEAFRSLSRVGSGNTLLPDDPIREEFIADFLRLLNLTSIELPTLERDSGIPSSNSSKAKRSVSEQFSLLLDLGSVQVSEPESDLEIPTHLP